MSQLAAPQKASPLAVMAARFNADPKKLYETLKATVFSAARNDEELQALVIVSNQYDLNPLLKEIYAFPAKGGGIVPVVSVDGWAKLANSHPQMDGVDFEWEHDGKTLVSCTSIVYRKDRSHPIKITEYLSECRRATDPWKMEHRMLRHKALIQGFRIAFGFAGIYDEDEAERITERDITPSPRAIAAPLNPFTPAAPTEEPQEPPAIEAEIESAPMDTAEPAQQSNAMLDALTSINDAQYAGTLTDAAVLVSGIMDEGEREQSKAALNARAKNIGCKWSDKVSAFVRV
jgi:phage recombination protein Bet